MKRIYTLILLLILAISCSSCGKKYQMSENAEEINYNEKGKYGFSYEGNIYYELPQNSYLISLKKGIKKGKITIYQKEYDKLDCLSNLTPIRTYLLEEGKTYLIYLNYVTKYDDNLKKTYSLPGEVIFLGENVDILIEHYQGK